jgi:cyd operon protein YbgT
MWYFSWILGLGLACTFAILNATWLELTEEGHGQRSRRAESFRQNFQQQLQMGRPISVTSRGRALDLRQGRPARSQSRV